MSALLYVLLTPALFYLGSRAIITRWLWSRYPPRLIVFMDCSACTGFWYGLLLAATVGRWYDLMFLGLPGQAVVAPIVVGLASMTWTPVIAGLVQWGFENLGSVSSSP